MSIGLRKVQRDDLDVLVNISRTTFHEAFAHANTEENISAYINSAFDRAKLESELNNTSSQFYFAILEGIAAGYCKINFAPAQSDINDSESLEIERIYVLKKFQNQKAGQFMMNEVITVARASMLKFIWLGVWEENPGAIRFYRKNGFVPWKKHRFMLGNDMQTDIIMRKDL